MQLNFNVAPTTITLDIVVLTCTRFTLRDLGLFVAYSISPSPRAHLVSAQSNRKCLASLYARYSGILKPLAIISMRGV